jgi:hypothetical protein
MPLKPLAHEHADGLRDATRDGELWKLWYTAMPSPEGMTAEIDRRLGLQASGSMLPWTVFDAAGRIGGHDDLHEHRRDAPAGRDRQHLVREVACSARR